MRTTRFYINSVCVILAVAGFSGCGGDQPNSTGSTTEEEHAHAHEGVHGGQVIELGDENLHAQLTHDDATHKVGVYLLDGTAKNAAPIDAPSVTINCGIEGKPSQFTLAAVPQPGETAGTASYFELESEELIENLDNPKAVFRLNVTISGKPYFGDFVGHAHDHVHGHDPDHE